jgi:hypothetical protein
MLVEQVMAIHGRGSSDPKLYRQVLERMAAPALRRALEESGFPFSGSASAEAGQMAGANSRAPESPEDRSPRELPTREPTKTKSTLP